MVSARHGPFGWEFGDDWSSFTGYTGTGFSRSIAGSGLVGNRGGLQGWIDLELADEPYLGGFAGTAIEVSGLFLVSSFNLASSYANVAAAVAGNAIRFPWSLRTSGNTVLGEWIAWKKTGGQLQLTWRQRETGGTYVYGSDFGVNVTQVYRYRLRFFAGTSPNLNRCFIQWGSDAGWSSQSIVQTAAPSAQADRITFGATGTDGGTGAIEIVHDELTIRSGMLAGDLWDTAGAYVIFREASRRVGYTQRATVWRAERELLDARYEYRRQGGCGKATVRLLAPRTLEAWTGQGFRNPDFGHKVGATIQSWTTVTSGGGGVTNSGSPYHANAYELAIGPGAGRAAIYQERATATKELVSGGDEVSLPTLAVERRFRVRVRYLNESSDDTGGIRIRVVNETKSLEWSIEERRWKSTSGFTKTENRFASAGEWTEALCEFHTHDGRLQPFDTYRFYIEADDSDGSPVVTVHVGEAYLEAWGTPPVYERLRGLENVGAVEIWARREDGAKAAHLFDAGVSTDYECVYSGFPTGFREDEEGRVEISADGWSSILRDRVAGVVLAGQSIADILGDLLTDMIDATDGPFFTSSIGEVVDDPTDRILDEFPTDGRSFESIIQELAELTPGTVSWGVDAAREFYFKAVANTYQHDPFNDNDNTVFSVYVDREASAYKRAIDTSQLTTKVTVLGAADEDSGIRPSATVDCARAGELYGVRHREVIEDSLETEGECAKKAQLLLAQEAQPKFKTELTLGPTRFLSLQRGQSLAPISVRESGRFGHSMASDGKIYSGGIGASIELASASSQYATFAPTGVITTGESYFFHIRTALPNWAQNTTYCPFSIGLNGGTTNKFLRFELHFLTSTIRIRVYVGTSGSGTTWTQVWEHTTANTAFAQTTVWTISKTTGGSVALDVYANGGLLTPTSSTAFIHGFASNACGDWCIGARHPDSSPTDFFDGKIDDFAAYDTIYSSSFQLGTTRLSRAMGKNLIAWITWDEATTPVRWRNAAGGYGTVTLVNSPTFTNALSGESGTGRRWGEGQTYGGSALLVPERIDMRFLGREGWEASYELGSLAPGLGVTLEQFDRELEKLREVVR